MNLNNKHKKQLQTLAHSLKPLVMIGNKGLTQKVLIEIKKTLEHHELIKIKVNNQDRETKTRLINEIVNKTQAFHIQTIGHIVVLYSPSESKKIILDLGNTTSSATQL